MITFNVENDCKKYGWRKCSRAIESLESDLIFLQEISEGTTEKIADHLEMDFISFSRSQTAILCYSTLEFVQQGQEFGVGKLNNILLINCHFNDQPYIAFEADGIKYDVNNDPTDNDEELIKRSLRSRIDTLEHIERVIFRKKCPIIAAGDFNEPSHHDWTEITTNEGLTPFPMIFPTSYVFENKLGFLDSYRYLHKNPIKFPGITWPAKTELIKYPHREDRIDFIFVKNMQPPMKSKVIKSHEEVLSDHNIVMSEFYTTY